MNCFCYGSCRCCYRSLQGKLRRYIEVRNEELRADGMAWKIIYPSRIYLGSNYIKKAILYQLSEEEMGVSMPEGQMLYQPQFESPEERMLPPLQPEEYRSLTYDI